MQPFTTHRGLVFPLDRANVNTDDIVPARFLKTIKRTGLADALFSNWRYLDLDNTPNPDFELNFSRYQGASIMVAGDNFGCGSSREHAPWAIVEYGFRAILAPGFADIFYNNCFNNGLLPAVLPEAQIEELLQAVAATPGYTLSIDLERQQVLLPDQRTLHFEIDNFRKSRLLKGLDMVGWTLSMSHDIEAYEQKRRQEAPWYFAEVIKSK